MRIYSTHRRARTRLRYLLHGLFVGALMLFPRLSAGVEPADLSVRNTDGVRFTFEPADAPFVDRVLTIVRTASPELRAILGQPVSDTIHIHIAPTQEAFLTYTPGAIPDWGAGYAVPDRRLVVLKSPRITGTYDGSYEIVVHELAHVMLHSALRGADIPRWLDEGFAMHVARDWGFWDRASLLVAVVSGNLISLGAIHRVNEFPEHKAHLAYQESALAVQYILRQYGEGGLHDLFDHLRLTRSINQASFNAFGISIVEFERNWLAYMERTYGWRMILGESLSILIAPLFGILCLFAYLQIRRRRRATLRRWAKEEQDDWHSNEDDWRRLNEEWVMAREREEDRF